MENPINVPSHLGGKFVDVKPEDLPNGMLVASTKGSVVKAAHYLDEIVEPRLAEAIAESKPSDVHELREIARIMREIAGKTYPKKD
jgi:hypothetical protein